MDEDDEITQGIDRFFGSVNRVTGAIAGFFGQAGQTSDRIDHARDQVRASRAARSRGDDNSAPGLERRTPFRIDEVIDAQTGVTTYLVTNGRERAECGTRAMAEIVLERLEPKGKP